jgi:hypothetical protein
VVYVSDRLVVYGRPGGATREKWGILDEKVESGLMSIEDRSSSPGEQD